MRKLILTCEHGGNFIPAEFMSCFRGKEEALFTHKGIDFGALDLALYLSSILKLEVNTNELSRLLIEFNRSLDNPQLFSDFTKDLSDEQKQSLINNFYKPYRDKVEEDIYNAIRSGNTVLHISVHSFTPFFENKFRDLDIGILIDDSRSHEVEIYKGWVSALNKIDPLLKVKLNEPYNGADDGFTTHLRTRFGNDAYAGIELEVNQAWFLAGSPHQWNKMKKYISDSIQNIIE